MYSFACLVYHWAICLENQFKGVAVSKLDRQSRDMDLMPSTIFSCCIIINLLPLPYCVCPCAYLRIRLYIPNFRKRFKKKLRACLLKLTQHNNTTQNIYKMFFDNKRVEVNDTIMVQSFKCRNCVPMRSSIKPLILIIIINHYYIVNMCLSLGIVHALY